MNLKADQIKIIRRALDCGLEAAFIVDHDREDGPADQRFTADISLIKEAKKIIGSRQTVLIDKKDRKGMICHICNVDFSDKRFTGRNGFRAGKYLFCPDCNDADSARVWLIGLTLVGVSHGDLKKEIAVIKKIRGIK